MPHIDPTVRFWIGIGLSILGAVASGSVILKGAFPDSWVPYIVTWAGIIAPIGNFILTGLNAAASTTSSRVASAAADDSVIQIITKKSIADSPQFATNNKVIGVGEVSTRSAS
jgi:hypothetical protein